MDIENKSQSTHKKPRIFNFSSDESDDDVTVNKFANTTVTSQNQLVMSDDSDNDVTDTKTTASNLQPVTSDDSNQSATVASNRSQSAKPMRKTVFDSDSDDEDKENRISKFFSLNCRLFS